LWNCLLNSPCAFMKATCSAPWRQHHSL
jgi:hypothetical protein